MTRLHEPASNAWRASPRRRIAAWLFSVLMGVGFLLARLGWRPRTAPAAPRYSHWRWGVTALALAGSLHTTSGATSPSFSSPPEATVQVGESFTYRITINQSWPLNSYDATPLPPGLTISKKLGIIRGKPTAVGITEIVIVASQDNLPERTLEGILTLNVTAGPSPPQFTLQPADTILILGESVDLKAEVTGAGPITYQWFRHTPRLARDLAVEGATNATLHLPEFPGDMVSGDFYVVASNTVGSNRSAIATVGTVMPPEVFSDPESINVHAGQTASLYAYADGGVELFYQWRKDGFPVSGATNSSLVFDPVTLADSGRYDVVFTNRAGGATSAVGALTVVPAVTPRLETVDASTVRLSFNAIQGMDYGIYFTDALSADFQFLTLLSANSTNVMRLLPRPTGQRFYRVSP